MQYQPSYDPLKTFDKNIAHGPYGPFSDGKVYENKGEPTHEIFGQKVYVPFGVAAGPLFNSQYIKPALEKGFDVVTYKTVRSRIYPCNPWPNLIAVHSDHLTKEQRENGVLADQEYSDPVSAANSYGVPSFDPSFWQEDMKKAIAMIGNGQLLVASFQGTTKENGTPEGYVKDYALTAKLVKETTPKIMEVNTSCPNEGKADLVCFDIDITQKIVAAIKEEIGNTPLIVKIAYFDDKEELKKLIKAIGPMSDGIEAINTVMSRLVDKNKKPALGEGRIFAGSMGHAIQWMGLEMVEDLKKLREELNMNYKIFGVGGVTLAEDYQLYRDAGADVVMSATGVIWNPYLAQEIKEKYL